MTTAIAAPPQRAALLGWVQPSRPSRLPHFTQARANDDYLVEGVKLQIGGRWVMVFDPTVDGQTDRVTFEFILD